MIGIIGSGTMGKGIAIEIAKCNEEVLLLSAIRNLSNEEISKEVRRLAKLSREIEIEKIEKRIIISNNYRQLKKCNFIIEAVTENLEIKRNIIKKSIKNINKDTIIVSNTSSLSVRDIFENLYNLEKVCGLHFFNPVNIMKLVELSYLEETSQDTIHKTQIFAKKLNKEIITLKESPGYIVNRLLIPMINEAAKLVENGIASVQDIDKAMKLGANHPLGPLKLSDLIGNDIVLNILKKFNEKYDIKISNLLKEKVKNNELGRKVKKGFYDYKKRSK